MQPIVTGSKRSRNPEPYTTGLARIPNVANQPQLRNAERPLVGSGKLREGLTDDDVMGLCRTLVHFTRRGEMDTAVLVLTKYLVPPTEVVLRWQLSRTSRHRDSKSSLGLVPRDDASDNHASETKGQEGHPRAKGLRQNPPQYGWRLTEYPSPTELGNTLTKHYIAPLTSSSFHSQT